MTPEEARHRAMEPKEIKSQRVPPHIDPVRVAAQDVVQAWNNPGRAPEYHRAAIARLRADWPVLAAAIEQLAAAYPMNFEQFMLLLGRFKTPDDVARWLGEKGYRGRQGNSCRCPIAVAIRTEIIPSPGTITADVLVSPHSVAYYEIYRGGGEYSNRVLMPDVVGNFITRFDQGEYPWLQQP